MRILVLDSDEESMRECLQAFYRRGWQVNIVSSFMDALRLLEHSAYDIVLIEMSLPDALGMEAWSFIHRMHPKLHGIITTSSGSLHRSINALAEDLAAYLLKPIDSENLCQLLIDLVAPEDKSDTLKRLQRRMIGLFGIFSAIAHATTSDEILEKTLAHLHVIADYELALWLAAAGDSSDLRIVSRSSISPFPVQLDSAQLSFVTSLAGSAIEQKQPLMIAGQSSGALTDLAHPAELGLGAVIAVPIMGQQLVRGVLVLVNRSDAKEQYEQIQLELLMALGQVLAITLDRFYLGLELQNLLHPSSSRNFAAGRGAESFSGLNELPGI